MSRLRRNGHKNFFVEKLVALLQDQTHHSQIKWTQNQIGFVISNVSQFTQAVLPLYFKHQNFSSFVRQLNMYGFNKIKGKDQQHVYENPNFKRGSKASLKKIQRKIVSQSEQKQEQIVLYEENRICVKKNETELQRVLDRQMLLQNKYIQLIQKNRCLLVENDTIVQAIRNEEKKRKRLIGEIMSIMNSLKAESLENGTQAIEAQKNETEQEDEINKRQKNKGLLDPDDDFLTLDDFLNIDNDSAVSEGLKL